jgi:hypothetical protein
MSCGINGTILATGRVLEVILPEVCLLPDGSIDIEAAGSITVSGLCIAITARPDHRRLKRRRKPDKLIPRIFRRIDNKISRG